MMIMDSSVPNNQNAYKKMNISWSGVCKPWLKFLPKKQEKSMGLN